jgi:hypothetical protein
VRDLVDQEDGAVGSSIEEVDQCFEVHGLHERGSDSSKVRLQSTDSRTVAES